MLGENVHGEQVVADKSVANNTGKARVEILYCTKCKWLLRASWMATELLSTFSDDIGSVSLTPSLPGTYIIRVWRNGADQEPTIVWDRKENGGFPYPKDIKKKIRDICFPEKQLGKCVENK
uniref:Selenoprotein W n=1 Tax=Aplanochytrium stocchinoi TaxID=215587 RepID=A0A6S8FPG4_9STRA|mmetsp:Transcript_14926/g.18458  ORF Transcript_14926/g.18458 Transcript_14926/m.18458 type:complete len:121 (-) Transcript_14926:758-1120(-)